MTTDELVQSLIRQNQRLEERLTRLEQRGPLIGSFSTDTAETNNVVDLVRLEHRSTGTAATGIGAGLVIFLQDASGNIDEAGNIDALLTDAAHATQTAALDLGALGTRVVRITNAGLVLINDLVNAKMTQGLTINHGANDDEALAIKNSDIDHALNVSVSEADTYFAVKKLSNTVGGAELRGYNDDGGAYRAIQLTGVSLGTDATQSTAGEGAVSLSGRTIDGAGAEVVIPPTFNLVVMRNYTTTEWICMADGSTWQAGGVESAKVWLTPEGGIAIKLIAEVALVAGEVVQASTSGTFDTQTYVEKNAVDGDMPIGVVYAAASAGADVWIVVAGLCSVLPEAGVTLAQADIIFSSDATAGRVDKDSALPSVTLHAREVGHCLVDGTGAGAAALCVVHFN